MRATLRIRSSARRSAAVAVVMPSDLALAKISKKSVVDLGGPVHGRIPALTLNLTGYGYYTAGVDRVVGCIEDTGLGEGLGVVRLLKLVVGGPGYDWRLDLGNGVVV